MRPTPTLPSRSLRRDLASVVPSLFLAALAGAGCATGGGSPDWARQMEDRLEAFRVSMNGGPQPAGEVLTDAAIATQTDIVIDPRAYNFVEKTPVVDLGPAGQRSGAAVLAGVEQRLGWTHAFINQAVYVTTAARLEEFRRTVAEYDRRIDWCNANREKLREWELHVVKAIQRASEIDQKNFPVEDIRTYAATTEEILLHVDPLLYAEYPAHELQVTIRCKSGRALVKDVVWFVLAPRGLSWMLTNGGVFISTPAHVEEARRVGLVAHVARSLVNPDRLVREKANNLLLNLTRLGEDAGSAGAKVADRDDPSDIDDPAECRRAWEQWFQKNGNDPAKVHPRMMETGTEIPGAPPGSGAASPGR
ncbi:MAG: hypothetical protein HY719_01070 [Planctomycetes bacterium]|nr:hypothetical protein [Planctomycetota bacterium]